MGGQGGGTTAGNVEDLFKGFDRLLRPQRERPGDQSSPLKPESPAQFLLRKSSEGELKLLQSMAPKFIDLETELRERSIQGDPLARGQRNLAIQATGAQADVLGQARSAVLGGLEGLNEGVLPADIERNLRQRVAGTNIARGLDPENEGRTLETVAALLGGSENLRSTRLGQAQAFLTGAAQTAAPGLGFTTAASPRSFNLSNFVQGIGIQSAIPSISAGQTQLALQENQFQQDLGAGLGKIAPQLGAAFLS